MVDKIYEAFQYTDKCIFLLTYIEDVQAEVAALQLYRHDNNLSWCTAVALKRQWPPRGWQGDIVGWRRGLIFQWKNGGHHYTFGGYVVQVTIKITTDKMKGSLQMNSLWKTCAAQLYDSIIFFHFLMHHSFFSFVCVLALFCF